MIKNCVKKLVRKRKFKRISGLFPKARQTGHIEYDSDRTDIVTFSDLLERSRGRTEDTGMMMRLAFWGGRMSSLCVSWSWTPPLATSGTSHISSKRAFEYVNINLPVRST